MIPGSFIEPAWSKSHPVFGANLALTGSGGIYVMQPDGSEENFVVARGREPSWSPDGTRLAYINNVDQQVFVISIFEPISGN